MAGDHAHRVEALGADFIASPAFNAYILVDDMDQILAAPDPIYGAFPEADHAGLALVRIDVVGDYFTDLLLEDPQLIAP